MQLKGNCRYEHQDQEVGKQVKPREGKRGKYLKGNPSKTQNDEEALLFGDT